MPSKNVEAVRKSIECWNRRDFEGTFRDLDENCAFTDHARGETVKGKQKIRDYFQGWAKAFSDSKLTIVNCLDAGDTVICEFTAEGTNDGPFAGLPPTHRHGSLHMCEIWRFDKQGRRTSGGCYYDMYGMLTNLGHLKPLTKAA